MARALALARRHQRLRRGARAGRGLRPDGLPPRVAVRRGQHARGRTRRLAGLVRDHARRALHRDLLNQPGRRHLQGLRAQLRRGAALARLHTGREARRLAPHQPGGHGLALQPLCRACAPRQRCRPPAAGGLCRPARGPRLNRAAA
ncbi:hypothetical protein RA210_U180029 [Rubrivivax sp. A210]|nr:hypothetical protein RA210_U180029 [Rubrivivax sp. A210]